MLRGLIWERRLERLTKGCDGAEVERRPGRGLADQGGSAYLVRPGLGGSSPTREGADHLQLTALNKAAATLRLDPS